MTANSSSSSAWCSCMLSGKPADYSSAPATRPLACHEAHFVQKTACTHAAALPAATHCQPKRPSNLSFKSLKVLCKEVQGNGAVASANSNWGHTRLPSPPWSLARPLARLTVSQSTSMQLLTGLVMLRLLKPQVCRCTLPGSPGPRHCPSQSHLGGGGGHTRLPCLPGHWHDPHQTNTGIQQNGKMTSICMQLHYLLHKA
jgi:hypothetical protein